MTAGPSGSTVAPTHRKVAMATLVGTTLEWYDFMLYGTASALILGKQFFPSMSPAAGTLAAFATFAVGFGARPIGGLLFGHFGDRIGRRTTLVVSLILMGVSSTLIGVLPTYDSIGFWAPVLLVMLRLIQGVGLGGEGAGAVVFSMEHAPHGRLNRYASFPQMGTPAGLVLANAVFLGTSALMPEDAFLSWGWRIPFLLSVVLVVVGLVVRLTITESAQYADLVRRGEVPSFPLRDALRVGPARLLLILCAAIATSAVVYIFMVFTLTYGTKSLDFSRDFLLLGVIVSSVLWCLTMPLWGALADRYGTHRVFLAGTAALLVWSAVYFPLLNTGNPVVVYVALLGMGAVLPISHSVGGIIVAELFPPAVRYSGTSLIVQVSVILGGGLAPLIATALWTAGASSLAVSCYAIGICTLSLISTYVLFWVLPLVRAGKAVEVVEDQHVVRAGVGAEVDSAF
ncbi:MHS family MFS transporter [Nocardia cyriacigeorgica]|uniref:Putative proline/betaine transporter n=1 Tax=Nocardia cyriacigeorgica TaxID=135487 RepID=A0A6P1DA89_9NOCA|nr:MFS transporter [Nocardia cyriacigeorgica]NEW45222.1 MHS family MFS transporter [Nocardia cyriacigeorgica]NEW51445.1 MHS family MFS transporter [Nocardia cyriacigeorgica]